MIKRSIVRNCLSRLLAILLLIGSSIATAQNHSNVDFYAKKVEVPLATRTLQLAHKSRHNSGGFSSLWMTKDCSKLTTISDYSQVDPRRHDELIKRSGWYQLSLTFDDDDLLENIEIINQGQIKDLDGSIMQGAAESIAKQGDDFLVSFDDRGTIYRYGKRQSNKATLDHIPTVAYNQAGSKDTDLGLESTTMLHNGDLFELWESSYKETIAKGKLLKANGEQWEFSYRADASPGGATTLLDGSVLVLEKRWLGTKTGQRLRLVRVTKEQIESISKDHHTTISGQVLLDNISTLYDNNEGITSCKRGGKEWIFVLTDDNGDWPKASVEDKGKKRQRTLLMQFDLAALLAMSK